MRRLTIALASLFALALAAAIILAYFSGAIPENAGAEHGAPGGQYADAIRIALADPYVKEAIADNNGKYNLSVEEIDPVDAGYVNLSGRLVRVTVDTAAGVNEMVRFNVTVDPLDHKEMGLRYGGAPELWHDWSVIPPGAYAYYPFTYLLHFDSSGTMIQDLRMSVDYTPGDARAYPLVLDDANFFMLRNGSPYEAPELIDPSTGSIVRVDGSEAMAPHWDVSLALPADVLLDCCNNNSTGKQFYLAIKNGETSRDVRVDYQ